MQIGNNGFPYLASGDLVSDIDDYTLALYNRLWTMPFRMTAGTFVTTLDTSGYKQTGNIPFQTDIGFTKPPLVFAGNRVGGASGAWIWEAREITTTGFQARLIRTVGTWGSGPEEFAYLAIQIND